MSFVILLIEKTISQTHDLLIILTTQGPLKDQNGALLSQIRLHHGLRLIV